VLAWTVLWLGTALAADVDLFQPSGAYAQARGTPQGEEAVVGPLGPTVGVTTSYARRPTPVPDGVASVEGLMPLTLTGSWATSERARIDVALPTYAFVDAPVNDFRGAALGDLRVQVLLPTAGNTDAFRFAIAPQVTIPTGTGPSLTRIGTSAGVTMAFSGRSGSVGWLVDAGLNGAAADTVDGRGLGSSARAVAGLWAQANDAFRAGMELDLDQSLVLGPKGPNAAGSVHLFAQNRLPSGVALGLLGGTGWLRGVGAPEFRVGATLSWSSEPPTPVPVTAAVDDRCQPGEPCAAIDGDGDGIPDDRDTCVTMAEDRDGFQDDDGCPDPDNDGDGLYDVDDACPDAAGGPEQRGCPDQDADGVPDTRDLCPALAGPLETEGCPDRDRDRVPDVRDACPDSPAPPREEGALSDGCPTGAYVSADRIVLAEPIGFPAGSATLTPPAQRALDDVAVLLLSNPGLTIIEVGGHTDNRGDPDANKELSRARAEAVAAYLNERGVASGRLKTRGYGDLEPVDTNRTASGRARNARIELRIVAGSGVRAPGPPRGPGPVGPTGSLTIEVQPGLWADVYIDGIRLTKGAPFTAFDVAAGTHELRASNPGRGLDWSGTIEIIDGETLTVTLPWSVWDAR
jgi:outer membrane protein OmpA-like peptidoglycan-associated protein